MPIGMYDERLGNSNLRALVDVQGINTITSVANGLLGKTSDGTVNGNGLDEKTLRARRVEYFYNKMLLDTIKLGSENNVFLKYCETKEVPQGHAKLLLRRWAGLTEHTTPLKEGIPPKSDFMRSESFEGTFAQYGRYMEFADRMDFQLIDDHIARMAMEYGDLGVRTAERLCRNELLAMGSPNFAYDKGVGNISQMVIGDNVGIENYRLTALKLERILVKPINGVFRVICSPEHLYDLVEDPLVVAYMNYTHTAEPFKTGRPVELFSISFEKTMLDDYGFNYIGDEKSGMYHPGEFTTTVDGSSLDYNLRAYCQIDNVNYYFNFKDGVNGATRTIGEAVLKDGSFIPEKVSWNIDAAIAAFATGATGVTNDNHEAVVVDAALATKLKAAHWYELPVHVSFMLGQESIIKTGISGRTGAKMYFKEKGSAGVLDPIDQRQSIGFKIDTIGFTCVRPEAIQLFYFVPTKAAVTQIYALNHQPTWAESFAK